MFDNWADTSLHLPIAIPLPVWPLIATRFSILVLCGQSCKQLTIVIYYSKVVLQQIWSQYDARVVQSYTCKLFYKIGQWSWSLPTWAPCLKRYFWVSHQIKSDLDKGQVNRYGKIKLSKKIIILVITRTTNATHGPQLSMDVTYCHLVSK